MPAPAAARARPRRRAPYPSKMNCGGAFPGWLPCRNTSAALSGEPARLFAWLPSASDAAPDARPAGGAAAAARAAHLGGELHVDAAREQRVDVRRERRPQRVGLQVALRAQTVQTPRRMHREPRRRVLEVAQKAHVVLLERTGEVRPIRRAQRRPLQRAEQRGRSLLHGVAEFVAERVAGGEERPGMRGSGIDVRVVAVRVRAVAAEARRTASRRRLRASSSARR